MVDVIVITFHEGRNISDVLTSDPGTVIQRLTYLYRT